MTVPAMPVFTAYPRGATAVSLSEAAAASLFDEMPAAQVRESGVHRIDVAGEVVLAEDGGRGALSFIRFLRDSTSAGLWVAWSGTVAEDLDVGLLCHLPPPVLRPGLRRDAPERRWWASHQSGLCYYRVGPGFVQVTDRRPGRMPRNMTVGSPSQLAAFSRFLVPGPVTLVDDLADAACGELARAGLLLRIGDSAVTLPHRLSCRPVPWNVV